MIIFPALDLLDGRAVRLQRGRFDAVTVYDSNPVQRAQTFAAAGAEWLHLVDLEGARSGRATQLPLIAAIARNSGLKLQVGGGIRDLDTVKALFDLDVKRVVIGSLALSEPALLKTMLKKFGEERIVLAADLKWEGAVASKFLEHGWQKEGEVSAFSVISDFAADGLRYLLSTDISRDGMLAGAAHDLYQELRQQFANLNVIASGGISDVGDVVKLREMGVYGAIIGKALYEERLSLESLLQC